LKSVNSTSISQTLLNLNPADYFAIRFKMQHHEMFGILTLRKQMYEAAFFMKAT